MKQGLAEINELVGVWGSLICNNQGGLIDSAPPPEFNQAALENIARHSVELLSTGSESVQGLKEVVMHFQEKRLFILDLQQAVLVVLCTPHIDISLLRLTINVITSRWEEDSKVQKLLSKNYLERI